MCQWRRRSFVLLILVALLGSIVPRALAQKNPSADREAILALLRAQAAAWNRGDIRSFMEGYWKSDQTEFVGSSGVFHGWQAVLDRYLRTYPNRIAMGRLTFSDLEVRVLCPDAAYATGRWRLDRESDRPQGVFTLLFRKFPEGWRIVHDHTSAFPPSNVRK